MAVSIIGCGDVGTRLLKNLLLAFSADVFRVDFDQELSLPEIINESEYIYYFVAPQKHGIKDERTKCFLSALARASTNEQKIVLISTTGVYGDCEGSKVTEETAINPTTERSKRRVDMENQWRLYVEKTNSTLSILRVPGIYSHSRLPRKRIESGVPVVNPEECGYTNRIHADDLAMICQQVMEKQTNSDIYNVSDGNPGNISQYILDVAEYLNLPKPPVVSMQEGEKLISTGMMSYLKESRSIDSTKLLKTFGIQLKYTNYLEGIQF